MTVPSDLEAALEVSAPVRARNVFRRLALVFAAAIVATACLAAALGNGPQGMCLPHITLKPFPFPSLSFPLSLICPFGTNIVTAGKNLISPV